MKGGTISRMILSAGLLLASCLDPYTPPKSGIPASFLVVDGIIDVSSSLATVKLTRSVNLSELENYPFVTGATVRLQDTDGTSLNLPETAPGVYSASHLFDFTRAYTLSIRSAGKDYESDPIKLVRNTPISGLEWSADDTRLQVKVNSADPAEGPKYYRYALEETHEYRATFGSSYKFIGNQPVYRFDEADNITRCWRTDPVASIVLGSTEGLTENSISGFPVLQLEKGDRRLWHDYSLLVSQIPLDKAAYEYWTQLAKVSQSLGGLFDPIPFPVRGNIHGVSDPEEKVLGYISGGEVYSSRIRVKSDGLPDGYVLFPNDGCQENYVEVSEVGSIANLPFNITRANYLFITIIGYFYATPACTDCRLGGGKNSPPPFMN